ncbi:MAG: hypothetical protein GX286_00215 [Clostridiales bacterium]|nr:hypothetical protein [Clostridiales bacterium]
MKRIIGVGICFVILIAGIYFVLNREPKVDIGKVEIISEDSTISLEGHKIKKVYKDNINVNYKQPDILDIFDDIPSVNQNPDFANAGLTESATETEAKTETDNKNIIKAPSNAQVLFRGNYTGQILYSFYKMDGELIAKDLTKLEIPTGSISEPLDGCIVQIDVNWGRSKNYVQTRYFVKFIFE